MPKFLVLFNEKKCIGSGVCEAICPSFWRVRPSGKAELKGSRLNPNTNLFELEVDEAGKEENIKAADGCPPGCIQVVNKETGEKIAP